MDDQISTLQEKGIPATCLQSDVESSVPLDIEAFSLTFTCFINQFIIRGFNLNLKSNNEAWSTKQSKYKQKD